MTLIAYVTPGGQPFLVADILASSPKAAPAADIPISSSKAPPSELILPTGAYIPPEKVNQMDWRPSEFSRKILRVSPQLAIACAGDAAKAVKLMERLANWFRGSKVTVPRIRKFVQSYGCEATKDVAAMIVSFVGKECRIFVTGDCLSRTSVSYGQCFASGKGASQFVQLLDDLRDDPLVGKYPVRDALNLTSNFLGRELLTGETFLANFGGAFELLTPTSGGLEPVDDIVHVFVKILVHASDPRVKLHPCLVRQWYQGDCLYVASMVTDAGIKQGLHSHVHTLPPLISTAVCAEPFALAQLPETPKYVCLHHAYYVGSSFVRTAMMPLLPEHDDVIRFKRAGQNVKIDFTERHYADVVDHSTRLWKEHNL